MADLTYSPKLPLELDNDGNFVYIKDVFKNIKQNLKMLFLTNPGEKIMDSNFGIGIKKYLFEHSTVSYSETGEISDLKTKVYENIYKQVNYYIKDINITDIQINIEETVMDIKLLYSYKNFLQDTFEIEISL